MEKSQGIEDRVRKWLSENGYDYKVRTYQPGETPGDCIGRDKETISVPSSVEDTEAFMKQFVESFEMVHEISVLKKKAGDSQ